LREEFPVRELVKRGWVKDSPDVAELEREIFAFYGIGAVDEQPEMAMAAKRSTYATPLSRTQQAWVIRLRRIAEAVVVGPYRETMLRECLPDLQGLTQDPEEIRDAARILAECGVRLVIVEPLPGGKIDGVCLWLNEKSPVIGLSLRLDRTTTFGSSCVTNLPPTAQSIVVSGHARTQTRTGTPLRARDFKASAESRTHPHEGGKPPRHMTLPPVASARFRTVPQVFGIGYGQDMTKMTMAFLGAH